MNRILIATLSLSFLSLFVSAHGYMQWPIPRGYQKRFTQVDDLKNPNQRGMCRGEPKGEVTAFHPGQVVSMKYLITAPHIGNCVLFLMNPDFSDPIEVEQMMNCAAPGAAFSWDVTLPPNIKGRKVLRWTWLGEHVTPHEEFEQCADIIIGDGDTKSTPATEAETPDSGAADGNLPQPGTEVSSSSADGGPPKPTYGAEDSDDPIVGADASNSSNIVQVNRRNRIKPCAGIGNDATACTDNSSLSNSSRIRNT